MGGRRGRRGEEEEEGGTRPPWLMYRPEEKSIVSRTDRMERGVP
jgi:hypothetical protein